MNRDLFSYAWATMAAGFAAGGMSQAHIPAATDKMMGELEKREQTNREAEDAREEERHNQFLERTVEKIAEGPTPEQLRATAEAHVAADPVTTEEGTKSDGEN